MLLTLAGLVLSGVAAPTVVVADGLVIGEYGNGRWLDGQKLMVPTTATVTYRAVGLGTIGASATIKGFFTEDPPGGPLLGMPNDEREVPARLLVSGSRLKVPRKVRRLGTGSKTYVEALTSFLSSQKYKAKARLTNVISADLDGNGTQEILIEGSSRPRVHQGETKPGDYSVVLLRAIVGGRVRTIPIQFSKRGTEHWVNSHELLGVADFDGDGALEFVVTNDYYEGQEATVYRFVKGKLVALASNGAGV